MFLVCFVRVDLCHFSLPFGVGVSAVCDCGTPWIFLLTFLLFKLLRIALWPSVGKELSPWLCTCIIYYPKLRIMIHLLSFILVTS